MKWFCKEFCKKLWKKIINGTSDTWFPSRLSQWTSKPAYYIVDCRISNHDPDADSWLHTCVLDFDYLSQGFILYTVAVENKEKVEPRRVFIAIRCIFLHCCIIYCENQNMQESVVVFWPNLPWFYFAAVETIYLRCVFCSYLLLRCS